MRTTRNGPKEDFARARPPAEVLRPMRCARSPGRPADRIHACVDTNGMPFRLEPTPVRPVRTGSSPSCRPSRTAAVLMDADNGSIDHLDATVMVFDEGFHGQVQDASHPPTNEPIVAGRARPKSLRQIAPGCAGPQKPYDAVEDISVAALLTPDANVNSSMGSLLFL